MKKSLVSGYALAAASALFAAAGAFKLLDSRASSRLRGRIVLITGGSRGFGLQMARELANEGCKLILVARNSVELETAQAELRARSAVVEIIACDLTQHDAITGMLERARAVHGRIDIVVNDAGRIDVGPIDALKEQDFRAAMDLMFWAPVRITLGLLPWFLSSGDADIVNICSIGGKVAVPHLLPYSSAKFALCGFSEGLDTEVRSRGVRVLTVIPGLLRTGSHKQANFMGNSEAEYRWFALGATLPGVSMEVGRAARQVVSALKRKRRSLTLSWSAQVAMRMHGAFPALSMLALQQVNRLLPAPDTSGTKLHGKKLQSHQSELFRFVTSLGEVAAESQNENLS